MYPQTNCIGSSFHQKIIGMSSPKIYCIQYTSSGELTSRPPLPHGSRVSDKKDIRVRAANRILNKHGLSSGGERNDATTPVRTHPRRSCVCRIARFCAKARVVVVAAESTQVAVLRNFKIRIFELLLH